MDSSLFDTRGGNVVCFGGVFIPRLWVCTIVVSEVCIRSCSVGIIGQPFTKILMILPT